jgi:hypothetical protein
VPLKYSQFIWGFEVFDASSGSLQNNLLDFTRGGNAKLATLNAGIYTADELAVEVGRAMQAADPTPDNDYDDPTKTYFDYVNAKFRIGGTNSFTLNNNTGPNVADGPWGLLGFDTDASPGDLTGTAIDSSVAVGSTPISTAGIWTMAEPLVMTSPITAQGAAPPAPYEPYESLLAQRTVKTMQHVSDGGTVESVFISMLKSVQIGFRALTSAEQAGMESFLDWALTGKRFTWQPDKTSAALVKLVLANPGQVNNQFVWLTRSETTYGTLSFYEQLNP